MATPTPLPIIIPHASDDHRWIDVSELTSLKLYNNIMSQKPLSTIMDFAMTSPTQFLKSTSKWNENHLIAFRCLLLENLNISRIIPSTDLPDDNDESMKLVHQHLSATEANIRSGKSAESLGPATTFYQQLRVVIRRPSTPPSPIPIPKLFRPSTLNTAIFPSIPESELSGSDSSYQPSPPIPSKLIPSATGRNTIEVGNQSRTSMESVRSDGAVSVSSTEEDKLESVANQAAVSLLGLLCTFEDVTHPNRQQRLVMSNETLPPVLIIHGQVITSFNDGSFFIETRSTRRPNDWVKRDSYPRASLECKRKAHSRDYLILAQELGEILAIGHNRHINNVWLERDREVYLVGIHHDKLYIIATEFPEQYFDWVIDEVIPPGGCLVMRRSKIFDLSKSHSRIEACRLLLGMMRRILV